MIKIGTPVQSTMNGRTRWTGTVIGYSGTHQDQLRVRRDDGSVSDWRPDQWTVVGQEDQTTSWVSVDAGEIKVESDLGDDGTVVSFTDTPSGRHLTTSLGERLMVPWGECLTVRGTGE